MLDTMVSNEYLAGGANETKIKQVEKPRRQCLVWEVGGPHPTHQHPQHPPHPSPAALTGCHTSSPRPLHYTLWCEKEIICSCDSDDAAKHLHTQLTFARAEAEDFASVHTGYWRAAATRWREQLLSVFELGLPTVAVK